MSITTHKLHYSKALSQCKAFDPIEAKLLRPTMCLIQMQLTHFDFSFSFFFVPKFFIFLIVLSFTLFRLVHGPNCPLHWLELSQILLPSP